MKDSRPPYSYRETRFDLEQFSQKTTVSVRLPTIVSSTSFSGIKQSKASIISTSTVEDETAFRRKCLATASSIYHRRHLNSPRSFLWRVLEDGKVLSICAIDISIPKGTITDSNLMLQFNFPSPIIPACIAFSDPKNSDLLNVFVLTESKQVWTLDLQPEFFRNAQSMDENIVEWCNIYSPRSLSIKSPYRLVALNEDDLLISFHDGALARLERGESVVGIPWKEQQYNEGGWGHSFRSMVPFQHTNGIYCDGQYIQPSAAVSIASPAINIGDAPIVFTVTVDHRLRIWDLRLGIIAYTGDILTQEIGQHDEHKKFIDTSQTRLIQLVTNGSGDTICITYSPYGSGQFKFWHVTKDYDDSLTLVDLLPESLLIPQAPSADLWTIADFAAIYDKNHKDKLNMWVLWKNNVTYQLMKLEFFTTSAGQGKETWSHAWKAIALDQIRDIPIPRIISHDPSDVTEKWLEFILYPGRFSAATIETGLSIYEQGLGLEKDVSRKSRILADRMCTSIASTVELTPLSDESLNFDQFRSATYTQWMRFYRLLIDLHEQRGEAISLVIDPEGQIPSVLLADGISIIRQCSQLEEIWFNSLKRLNRSSSISKVLFAAKKFRDSIPDNFFHACNSFLCEEIYQEPSLTVKTRMIQFYEKCDFANQVTDEDYDELLRNLDGNLQDLNPEVYNAIIRLLSPLESIQRETTLLPLSEFANKIVVNGIQQIIQLYRQICVDQLILLIFIENEVNYEKEGTKFEIAPIYNQLIVILFKLELIHWLTSTEISIPVKKAESLNIDFPNNCYSKSIAKTLETITVFEGVLRHFFSLGLRTDQKMTSSVTEMLVMICAVDSSYELSPTSILCFLLKHDRPDLALEFSRFTGSSAFSTYLLGRTNLALDDIATAALLFKKAAVGMALPIPRDCHDRQSAGYLDETEKSLLNLGFPKYYSHIVNLFQRAQIYSYVAEFAQLSLRFVRANHEENEICSQMRTDLFHAAVHTARYEVAYSALTLVTSPFLKHSLLRTLITKMCETSNASDLMLLPFIGLQDKFDDILSEKCHESTDMLSGVSYHKILYTWRIKHNNYRGAAEVLFDRLRRLQESKEVDDMIKDHQLETPITQQYISLINTLSCVNPKHAWLLFQSQDSECNTSNHRKLPKRQIITLADLRNDYQAELDRLAAIHNNQFQYGGSDAMDILSS